MKKEQKVKETYTVEELRKIVKSSKDEGQKTRIRAIIDLLLGKTKEEVMTSFVISRTTLWFWINKYNKKGPEGLIFSKGGRKEGNPKWDKKIFDELIKEIDKNEKLWSLLIMQEWIEEKYNTKIPLQTIWYHLWLKKYSYKSLRPSPYKGDEEVQEAFKKKAL